MFSLFLSLIKNQAEAGFTDQEVFRLKKLILKVNNVG